VKAKPLVVACCTNGLRCFSSGRDALTEQIYDWAEGFPKGTKFKVTVEEVKS
jgi:hypothetical protein